MKIDPIIFSELRRLLKKKIDSSFETVVIVSAYELDGEEKQVLTSQFGKLSQNLNLDYRVDPTILGGIIIKIHSSVIDLSLKGRLESLKHDLYESA